MKNIVAVLLIIFSPFIAFCEIPDSTKTKKIEIGVTYSPNYCYRKLRADASGKWLSDIRDTMEIAKFGYSAGFNIVYKIKKNFTLGSGILFSDKGERTKKYSLGNSPAGKLPINNTDIHHYIYLDIPVKGNYYILTGKLKLFLTAGISTNILLTQRNTSILGYGDRAPEKSSSTVNSGLSKINFAFIAGFGIDCPVTDKTNFKIEPIYSRSIHSIIDAPIKSYLYSAGLNIGIYYKL